MDFKVNDFVITKAGVTKIIETDDGLRANNATNLLDCKPLEAEKGAFVGFGI